jgi:hypothetical protein
MFGALTTGIVGIAMIFFREEIQTELENADSLDGNFELKKFLEQPGA